MLIVLVIAGAWLLGMLLVAGLCASAAAGDRELEAQLAIDEGEVVRLPPRERRPAA